jgi:hypothetical protein
MFRAQETKVFRTLAIAAVALSLTAILDVRVSSAELKTTGKGERMSIDPASIPESLKPNLSLMNKKCSKCHGLDRTIKSLQTGSTPSGMRFDKGAIKAYGIKMLKKPDSDMNGLEVKKVLELLNWAHDEVAK